MRVITAAHTVGAIYRDDALALAVREHCNPDPATLAEYSDAHTVAGVPEDLDTLAPILAAHRAKAEERKAADAAKVAQGIRCPSGRVPLAGEVVSVREESGQWGTTYKGLIVTAEGWKAWGSVPPGTVRGDRLSGVATLSPSDSDALFGFYSRPRWTETGSK